MVAIGGVVLRRLSGPYELVVLGFGLLIVVAMILFARRMFGRTWAPVGDLIDATQRLGDGDTAVRIAASGRAPSERSARPSIGWQRDSRRRTSDAGACSPTSDMSCARRSP